MQIRVKIEKEVTSLFMGAMPSAPTGRVTTESVEQWDKL
jgi:hypothetical protein